MNSLLINTSDLRPYKQNPRNNDNAIAAVAESIKAFGFKVPIVIDRENVIVCGHTRLKAAQMLKLEKVPCVIADDLTDEQLRAFRLADNKTAELAEWDEARLALELDDLSTIDMSAFGFNRDAIAGEWIDPEDDDEFADIEKLDKHYGVPYQGNKSRIADIIISLLPEGDRLVDLFGGGGAI
uniref:ParB N-terminal domain-containing protein n=1 Tax=Ruminococcus sp. TaxID=41978 RepID=UPI00387041B0